MHLWEGAQPEGVLDPSRLCVILDEQSHGPTHLHCAREGGGHFNRWAECLRVAVDRAEADRSNNHQAACEAVDVGNGQRRISENGGVARHEGERVTSPECGSTQDRRRAGFAPHSTRAVVASAARSAVPTLPPSRTGGSAS